MNMPKLSTLIHIGVNDDIQYKKELQYANVTFDFGKCKECGEAYLDGYYYNQFDDIKEMGNDGFATAIWKDGPLYYDDIELVYTRAQDIFLISWREERRIIGLYRSSSKISSEMKGRLLPQSPPEYIRNLFDCGRGRQKGINESLLNEIRKDPEVYGISQNPDTIVVKNMCIKNGVNLSNRLT
ncbi:kinase-like domain-containing protein [Rhizophagus irregularis DAOM 181602=DAOM 197198]|nr:kinase-like domain-containing protein [Rhizophagus irregularis DAOM 181602=DAOM 197198]